MPCTKNKCACNLLNKTGKEKAKCRFYVVPISKFNGKRKRIKIDPNTGERIDNKKKK